MIARIMRPQTADLVDRIRGSDRYVPELSLVAVGDDNEIVGFVMLSRLEVRGDRRWNALALAPLTVLESHQGTGVGSSLTQDALRHADDLGERVVIVLGDPGYYPRLGFVPASGIGICPPQNADIPSDAWMARPLTRYTADLRGTVWYSPDFIETGSVPGL
jgi:predicted N-acetyltransferase YhbS